MVTILNITNLKKSFTSGDQVLNILDDINIVVNEKETFSIVGPSGSGKTTLLSLCAGLDNLLLEILNYVELICKN